MIPKKSNVVVRSYSKISLISDRNGQYDIDGFSSRPDNIYYYQTKDESFHIASFGGKRISVYNLSKKMKYKSKKKVKTSFGKIETIFHGADNKIYVVSMKENPKEIGDQIVIHVDQYTEKWKKIKSCSIPAVLV